MPSTDSYCGCERAHSVTSAHVDLAVDNNVTWSDALQFGDPTDLTWNLVGCTFAMDVQLNYYDVRPKLSLSSNVGTIVIDDAIQRVIHFNVPSEMLEPALSPGDYVYDLVMTDAAGTKTALAHGCVTVSQGATGV